MLVQPESRPAQGNEGGIEPASLTRFQLGCDRVTLLERPQDPKEAWLLRREELKICYRQGPSRITISRKETDKELVIELCFRRVLHKLAIETEVAVNYTPAGGEDRGKDTKVGHKAENELKNENM